MADDLIDQKKIATTLSQRAIDRFLLTSERKLKEYWAEYRNRDVDAYSTYLARKRIQANSVRNFIYDQRDATLDEIYIPTRISTGPRRVSDGDEIINLLCQPRSEVGKRNTQAFIVTGTAGTGKSLFLKHAFFQIQQINEPQAKRIPILIEVRSFNRLPAGNLIARIHDSVAATGAKISYEQIEKGLESGLFVLLLDGMDELKPDIHNHYVDELLSLTAKYPSIPILVSSRPTDRLNGWSSFEIIQILPLDLHYISLLVSKICFNELIKDNFLKLVEASLYKSHHEFVSIPLLCMIMLLTFADNGKISNRRHEFFEDAFAALWSKHDSRKEGYERQKFSRLERHDFVRLLSAFAISSYTSADYNMRDSQFASHFRTATALSGTSCQEDDFRRDLIEATCVCVEDGPFIRFCHKSFHEYFSAIFICDCDDNRVFDLVEDIYDRTETDYVLPLVLSLRPDKIEKNWVIPTLQKISAEIDVNPRSTFDYFETAFPKRNTKIARMMETIRHFYEFNPSNKILIAASQNIKNMRLPASDINFYNIFEEDRENFLNHLQVIIDKYNRKATALNGMLSHHH